MRSMKATSKVGGGMAAHFSGHETFPLRQMWLKKAYDQAKSGGIKANKRRKPKKKKPATHPFADYDNFYNSKALWHPELDELTPSTQQKLRQNLFRMLREADLISEQHVIQAALLSPHLVELLARRGAGDLMVFPVSDSEIQRWLA